MQKSRPWSCLSNGCTSIKNIVKTLKKLSLNAFIQPHPRVRICKTQYFQSSRAAPASILLPCTKLCYYHKSQLWMCYVTYHDRWNIMNNYIICVYFSLKISVIHKAQLFRNVHKLKEYEVTRDYLIF